MNWAGLIARIGALALLLALILTPELFKSALEPLTENGAPAIYNQGSLLDLTLDHLALVAASSLIATILAVVAGVLVTRDAGAEFLPLSRSIAHIGQTFPPVAALALAVPAVGFGVKPTMIALVLLRDNSRDRNLRRGHSLGWPRPSSTLQYQSRQFICCKSPDHEI